MSNANATVLQSALQVMRPLARLLLRHGLGYPALAAALKKVFIDAAHAELAQRGMPATDSAITLLCGVHRRDVRELTRANPRRSPQAAAAQPLGLAGQVVARWLSEPRWQAPEGGARPLPRSGADGFDALAAGTSQDVRARALLDELLRLGLVQEHADGSVALHEAGFAPRHDLAAMAQQLGSNLHDHAAAAVANLAGEANHLEQALFVDQLGPASVAALREAARSAWRQAFGRLMPLAQQRFDADARQLPTAQRRHRLRVGMYFYSEPDAAPAPRRRAAHKEAP